MTCKPPLISLILQTSHVSQPNTLDLTLRISCVTVSAMNENINGGCTCSCTCSLHTFTNEAQKLKIELKTSKNEVHKLKMELTTSKNEVHNLKTELHMVYNELHIVYNGVAHSIAASAYMDN